MFQFVYSVAKKFLVPNGITIGILSWGLAALPSHAFVYGDFASVNGLNLLGAASKIDNKIRITPPAEQQYGAVWRQGSQSLSQGFRTSFDFQLSHMGGILDIFGHKGTDGISFFVQTAGDNVLDVIPINPVVAPRIQVSFDAYANFGENPSSSSLHIWRNQVKVSQVDLEPLGIVFRNEQLHRADVSIINSVLNVSIDGTPALTLPGVNLGQVNPAYVGFQGYSGGAYANQDILNWSFVAVPEPAAIALAGTLVLYIGVGRRFGQRKVQ